MQKNKKTFTYFMMLSIWLSAIMFPFCASAYDPPTKLPLITYKDPTSGATRVCPDKDNREIGFTSRLIPCIRDTIIYATTSMLGPFSKKMISVLIAVFSLAVVIWGISVLTGNATNLTQNGFILALKIGAIVLFADNFWGLYPKLLSSMEDLLNILATPAVNMVKQDSTCTIATFNQSEQNIMRMWGILDCYIDTFIGGILSTNLDSKSALEGGVIGFIMAAIFSTSIGIFVAMAGIYVILTFLFSIVKAIYIFLTSYIAFSFMVLISSIFIPCILFKSTKNYFDNWLQTTISFLIQPIFLFGYLVMFLVAFDTSVFHGRYSLYYIIAGEDSQVDGFRLGKWMSQNNIYSRQLTAKDNIKVNPDEDTNIANKPEQTAVQGTQLERLFDRINLTGDSLNFFEIGVEVNVIKWDVLAKTARPTEFASKTTEDAKNEFYTEYKISVFLSFVITAIIIYVFYSLIEYLPYIGSGVIGSGVTLGSGVLAPPGSRSFSGGM